MEQYFLNFNFLRKNDSWWRLCKKVSVHC